MEFFTIRFDTAYKMGAAPTRLDAVKAMDIYSKMDQLVVRLQDMLKEDPSLIIDDIWKIDHKSPIKDEAVAMRVFYTHKQLDNAYKFSENHKRVLLISMGHVDPSEEDMKAFNRHFALNIWINPSLMNAAKKIVNGYMHLW